MTTRCFEALEKQTHILEEIASKFPRESLQYVALENVAFALIFSMTEHYESFVSFVEDNEKELSEEQKENLRKMGISV